MKTSVKAALIRIFILLLIACAVAFGWETSRNSNLQPVTGYVIAHEYRDYTIRYSVQGQNYQFVTRRGVLDFFSDLKSLRLSDKVPVLVSSKKPHISIINTLNGRYGITVTFVTLMFLFIVSVTVSVMNRKNSNLNKKH